MKSLLRKVPFLSLLGMTIAISTATGCSEPATTACSFKQPNGQTIDYACGEGYRCAMTQAICIQSTCGDGVQNEGEECDDGNLQNGDGCSKDCKKEICGNGILDPIQWDEESQRYMTNEVCDPGIDGKCSEDCKSNLACGNGIVDPQEACDHGLGENSTVGDHTCSANCHSNMTCGNGILDRGYAYVPEGLWEECDKGDLDKDIPAQFPVEYRDYAAQGKAHCTDKCKITYCGDNIAQGGEECDSGGIDTPNCTAQCKTSQCGDGYVNSVNEDCDPNNPLASEEERSACNPVTCKWNVCGDGYRGFNNKLGYEEGCDYAEDKYSDNKLCNQATCRLNVCGDGFIGQKDVDGQLMDEECDDGNANDVGSWKGSPTCNEDCTKSRCGDGVVNESAGEECDEGGSNTPTCNADCKKPVCGDNFFNSAAGEECDSGENGSSNCNANCTIPICGDGILNEMALEECDPGMAEDSGTGPRVENGMNQCKAGSVFSDISHTCNSEIVCNYNCKTSICGDSIANGIAGEQCDDGKEENITKQLMAEAVNEFCQALAGNDPVERYMFTDDNDIQYSFCDLKSGVWTVSFQADGKQTSENRRAAAEYYYTQKYLTNVRYNGKCQDNCQLALCGNGVIDVGEVCDGDLDAMGGTLQGTTCSGDCRSTQLCGNGIIDLNKNEVCDPPVNGCKQCTSGLTCGNSTVESGEQCDTGPETDNTGFCVITDDTTKMGDTWNRVLYREEPTSSIASQQDCAAHKGLWAKDDNGINVCFELRNCIAESVHENMCLKKISSPTTCDPAGEKLDACYVGLADDPNECNNEGNGEYEKVTVCISKSCKLATCGDGFVHQNVEGCDHGQTELKSNDEACQRCDEDGDPDGCRTLCANAFKIKSNQNEGTEKFCNYNCQVNECGDGIVNQFAHEECDWGDKNGLRECPNGTTSCKICSSECKMISLGCGDGVVADGETCDHMVSKEGGTCNETDFTGCLYRSDASKCGTYPCDVCEQCQQTKTYYHVQSLTAENGFGVTGYGTIASDDINFNCSSETSVPPQCNVYTTKGSIEFTAIPRQGYELTSWGEAQSHCTGTPESRKLKCIFNADNGQVVLRPVFEKKIYSVTARLSDANGGIISGVCTQNDSTKCACTQNEAQSQATCVGEHTDAILFTVIPTAQQGTSGKYVFSKWEEGCPSVGYGANGNPTCAGAIGTGWELEAVMLRQYLLNYSSNDNSMGSVSSSVASGTSVSEGTILTFVASPESKHTFLGWELSGGYQCEELTTDSIQNPCVVVVQPANNNGSFGNLTVVGKFAPKTPTISASALVVENGVSSDPTGASHTFTCECQDKSVPESEFVPCQADVSSSNVFNAGYGQRCRIGVVSEDLNGLYQFSQWQGCNDVVDGKCVIDPVLRDTNAVQAVYAKNNHHLFFATTGLMAGESLAYQCAVKNGDNYSPVGSCHTVFALGAQVRVQVDLASSSCRSEKSIELGLDGSSETAQYTCSCVGGMLANCKDEHLQSVTSLPVDVVMSHDRILSATVRNTTELTLSAAQYGAKNTQLHGRVTGYLLGNSTQSTIFSCAASDCYSVTVGKDGHVRLTAVADAGYQLTAWRIDSGSNVQYIHDSVGTAYIVDDETRSLTFYMTENVDITPVFMPVLTAAVNPENAGGTLQCSISNCGKSSSPLVCTLPEINTTDTTNDLYQGYVQEIEGTVSGDTWTFPGCSAAVSPTANVEVALVGTLDSGYTNSGWRYPEEEYGSAFSGNFESQTNCSITNINAPVTVSLTATVQTGAIGWTSQIGISETERAEIKYFHVEQVCATNANPGPNDYRDCSTYSGRDAVRFKGIEVANATLQSGEYYIISVKNSPNRDVQLRCIGNNYRCVSDLSEGTMSFPWATKCQHGCDCNWSCGYNDLVTYAENKLENSFSTSTGVCSDKQKQYIQCLTQYSQGNTASVTYADITKSFTLQCDTGNGGPQDIRLSGKWQNTSNSPAQDITISCGETLQVAQRATMNFTSASLPAGYKITSWKLENAQQTACNNKDTCSFTMPTTAVTLQINASASAIPLTVQTTPGAAGTIECANQKANGSCGAFSGCQENYEYNKKLCIRITPSTEYELSANELSRGCLGENWVENNGQAICSNVVMNEARNVSLSLSPKPVITYSTGGHAECTISCTAGVDCPASANNSVRVASGSNVVFSADKECNTTGDGVPYELLFANNTHTCPVPVSAWSFEGSAATCSLNNVQQSATVYAIYTAKPSVTVTSPEHGALVSCDNDQSVIPGTTYHHTNEAIALCAQADENYEFDSMGSACPSTQGWQPAAGDKYKCEFTVASNSTVSANFKAKPQLTLSLMGNGVFFECNNENVSRYDGTTSHATGEAISICTRANEGFEFNALESFCPGTTGWVLDGTKYKCEFNIAANATILAQFDAIESPTNTIAILKVGNGKYGCYKAYPETSCSTDPLVYNLTTCSESFGAGETMCVRTLESNATSTLTNCVVSSDAGTFEGQVCAVSYEASASVLSVALVFEAHMTVTWSEPSSSLGSVFCKAVPSEDSCPVSQETYEMCNSANPVPYGMKFCMFARPTENYLLDGASSLCGAGQWNTEENPEHTATCVIPYVAGSTTSATAVFQTIPASPDPEGESDAGVEGEEDAGESGGE